ncbi:peptidoglycan-binding domain-containing protein [Ensifer soli]|uniref:peptidoglycan-binding domain-containing protein n=1 Tax=Ciceribacter sp. sgz301302 TaxID=3342379 RepID=UPI0035B7C721
MPARKQKRPEKARARRPAPGSLVVGGLAFVGRFALRHPGPVAGGFVFAAVFGFVAANAMWQQQGMHPAPLMRTRLPAGMEAPPAETDAAPRKVTTFVIEREPPAAGAGPATDAAAAGIETASLPPGDPSSLSTDEAGDLLTVRKPETEPVPAGAELVTAVQAELYRLGLYDGRADGKPGPKTSAAIRAFERRVGRSETGTASEDLLALLTMAAPAGGPARDAVAIPADRPLKTGSTKAGIDPVAAAIRDAEGIRELKDSPAAATVELVSSIQRGLANLAYDGIVVDGVAGEQTRAAILRFQKHYRLPPNGEPSLAVLRKMKDIGAL